MKLGSLAGPGENVGITRRRVILRLVWLLLSRKCSVEILPDCGTKGDES